MAERTMMCCIMAIKSSLKKIHSLGFFVCNLLHRTAGKRKHEQWTGAEISISVMFQCQLNTSFSSFTVKAFQQRDSI